MYSKSENIFIIPKPIAYSDSILIMTYHSGEMLDDIDVSEYMKKKIVTF